MSTKYIFIRHAESQKNLKDITGGEGEALTEKGKREAISLAKVLLDVCLNNKVNIIASEKIQAIQTAGIISNVINVDVVIDKSLTPAHLGVISGLSTKEIEMKYPEEFKLLKKWRNKEIDVSKLKICDMESPILFWNRMMEFLKSHASNPINIVVCTRSIMVLMYNYVYGRQPVEDGNYCHVDIGNCELIAFDYSIGNAPIIDFELTNIYE